MAKCNGPYSFQEFTARVASLEAELAVQKGIVAAQLKRIYGGLPKLRKLAPSIAI